MRLDHRDFELAATRARSLVEAARTRFSVVQAEADVARNEWADLGHSQAASDLLMRKPQLAEAAASLEGAEAALESALLDLERTKLLAPFDGRVRTESVEISQFVRRGEEMASLFAIDRVEVKLPTPLYDLRYVDLPSEKGDKLVDGPKVMLTALGSGEAGQWQGTITRVDGEVDNLSRMTHLYAEVFDPYGWNKEGDYLPLKIGMFVAAEIRGKRADGVYVIPRVALRGENVALIVADDNSLKFTNVEILRKQKDSVIVTSGISEGDRVVVSTMDAPVDGMKVRIAIEGDSGKR